VRSTSGKTPARARGPWASRFRRKSAGARGTISRRSVACAAAISGSRSLRWQKRRAACCSARHAERTAQRSGILPGDLITTFGRHFISSGKELCALVASAEPRRGVELRLLRGGHEMVFDIDIDVARERPGLHRIPLPESLEAPSGHTALTPVVGADGSRGR
jgi:hypothetical protein